MIRSVSSRLSKLPILRRLWLLGLLATGPGHALDLDPSVQAHGFLSQTLSLSDHNDLGGNSSDGFAAELREVGANLSWRPNPDWLISGQALMRWAGKTDEGDLRLDYGFVDRTLLSGENRLGIQIGKIKNPFGFYNTTRDVAHTRPGVILPQSVYLDRIRNFFLAAPGASLYGEHLGEQTSLSWQTSVLRPEGGAKELEYVFLLRDGPGHFEGKSSWLAQALLEMDHARWRLGISLGNVAMRYAPAAAFPLDLKSGVTRLDTAVLSMEHNREHWSFTGEYAQTKVRDREFGDPRLDSPANDNVVESYYLQATWRFAPRWQGYLRHDAIYIDKDDRNGLQFQVTRGFPAHMLYAKDNSIGLRFDPNASWSLFAEVHHVDGTAWLSLQDNPPVGLTRKWNLLLLEAAYRF